MSHRYRSNLRQLERYIEACRRLLADLDDVLADLRFQKGGGRLHLAVDFSEIYAFALPGESTRDMVHFDSEQELEMGLAIEASALETIFFGRFGDIALLKPYRIELHNFLRRLATTHLERTADHLLRALSEVRALLEQEETLEIDQLQSKIEAGEKLNGEEIDRAIRYFDRHAPALVLFATRGPEDPAARLRQLLDKGCLAPPEAIDELNGELPDPGDEEIREIFADLEKRRRKPSSGANYLDAVALAQASWLNRRLKPHNARLLLISRSPTLAETVEAIGLDGVHLRHPRTWSAFFRPIRPGQSEAIEEVAERRRALHLFVESASQILGSVRRQEGEPTARDMDQTERLIHRIESMAEQWLLGQRVLMSGHLDPEDREGRQSHVVRLLEMVADDSRIFEEVRSRLDHLSRYHEDLGWLLQSSSRDGRKIIDSRLVLEGFEGKTVFSPSTADSIQYTIQFSSNALRRALHGFEDRWLVRFDELSSLLFEGLAGDDAYERLLAMAYTLGLLGRWKLAEKYAKAALDEAASNESADRGPSHVKPNPSVHEGHFFLAICQRKYRRSRSRIDAGLAHLHIAHTLKREHLGDGDYVDPRYVKEEATLLQVERSLLRRAREEETPERRRLAVQRIEKLLLQAIERARDDRYLLAQSYNGLCYLYSTEGEEYRDAMRRYRSELEVKLTELLEDPDAWPANCLDTLAWAHFIDREEQDDHQVEIWAKRLERVVERPLLAREDRERARRHLRLMGKALEARP